MARSTETRAEPPAEISGRGPEDREHPGHHHHVDGGLSQHPAGDGSSGDGDEVGSWRRMTRNMA